jgi:hypothetical protein
MEIGMLTREQVAVLGSLQNALHAATDCGLLDVLQDATKSPDSISDVCDAADALAEQAYSDEAERAAMLLEAL